MPLMPNHQPAHPPASLVSASSVHLPHPCACFSTFQTTHASTVIISQGFSEECLGKEWYQSHYSLFFLPSHLWSRRVEIRAALCQVKAGVGGQDAAGAISISCHSHHSPKPKPPIPVLPSPPHTPPPCTFCPAPPLLPRIYLPAEVDTDLPMQILLHPTMQMPVLSVLSGIGLYP